MLLQELDGLPISAGPDYRATFSPAGMQFTPALGSDSATGQQLRFELESASIGDRPVAGLDLEAVPRIEGQRVIFDRLPDPREVYEPRIDGVEQSFVFDSLPSRSGDLIVRGRLHSNVPLAASNGTRSELKIERPGQGGVRLSDAVGFDAAGRQVPARMRLDGTLLELSLPAEFLVDAELPLVLDPLFGPIVPVTDGSYEAAEPDIAFGLRGTEQRFGIAFERHWGGGDIDIYYAEVDELGTLMAGPLILEGTFGDVGRSPTVGYTAANGQFLVVWEHRGFDMFDYQIWCRQVFSDLDLSSIGRIDPGNNISVQPQLTCESSPTDNDLLLVWQEAGRGIWAQQIDLVNGLPPLPLGTITEVTTDPSDRVPAVSKNGGADGRRLVTWVNITSPTGSHEIQCALLDRNANILAPAGFLTSTAAPFEDYPDVDGNGETFVVAYHRRTEDAITGASEFDVIARRVTAGPSSWTADPSELVVDDDAFDDERYPAVAFAKARFFIAWQDSYATGLYDITYTGFGTNDCFSCEPEQFITSTGATNIEPNMATAVASGFDLPYADLVFTRDPGLGVTEVTFHAIDDSWRPNFTTDLGGACGPGGATATSGSPTLSDSFLGNSDFELRLSGADPAATLAILNIAGAPLAVPCGPCVWNDFRTVFYVTPTAGSATVNVAIPCRAELAGKFVQAQWTILGTLASPCALSPGVAISNRLEIELDY